MRRGENEEARERETEKTRVPVVVQQGLTANREKRENPDETRIFTYATVFE